MVTARPHALGFVNTTAALCSLLRSIWIKGFSFSPSGSTDHGIRHPIKLNSAKPCRSYIERSLITGKLPSFVSITVPGNGGSEVGCIDYGLNAAGQEV